MSELEPDAALTWTIHPARDNMRKTILSLIFIAVCLAFVFIFWGIVYGVIGLTFLFIALRPYYFPTHYELTTTQVIVKTLFYTQKRQLSEFKTVLRGKNGVLLSPFRHKTFLNNFRGIYLFLPPDSELIVGRIRELILPPVDPQPAAGSVPPGV